MESTPGGEMTKNNQKSFINSLQDSRQKLEELLGKVNKVDEIYPGWTIKDLLAHIAGWDEVVLNALIAHASGEMPVVTAKNGLNQFNLESVQKRKEFSYEKVIAEFEGLRQKVLETILTMPGNKLSEPFISPWGQKLTISDLVDIFSEHELEHAEDIHRWLEKPNRPISKEGK
jgi:hypothetical protein